jgi:hypothetical protein
VAENLDMGAMLPRARLPDAAPISSVCWPFFRS